MEFLGYHGTIHRFRGRLTHQRQRPSTKERSHEPLKIYTAVTD
jgi:hypothetical protein